MTIGLFLQNLSCKRTDGRTNTLTDSRVYSLFEYTNFEYTKSILLHFARLDEFYVDDFQFLKSKKQLYLYSMETDVDHHLFVRKMEITSQDHE